MIKEQINITCGGSTYENCTLIVPSQVQTSTPQEETLDLEKSPNFQIVVPGVYLDKGTHEITFSVGGNDCTANMIVVNNGSVSCTLQYVDGMTIEEGDSSDDSSDDGSSDDPDEPTETSFTYDGSDENSPIQVNVDLANYPGGEIDSVPAPEVNIIFSAPASDYDWNNPVTWGNYQELNSNALDCTLLNSNNFDGTWTLGDLAYGYLGPRIAGTYLRSYSVTFNYNSSYSMKYDEITGERIDDPVAQALDGTTITFWVQYNVTGTIPNPDEPTETTFTYDGSDQNDPIICNVRLGDDQDITDVVNPNISVIGAGSNRVTQDITVEACWTPDIANNGLLSNDNDFKLISLGSIYVLVPQDNNERFSGTRTVGTYLKSYTITYAYSDGNGEDPVMQQLDGTSITFWVQYNVTDSGTGE